MDYVFVKDSEGYVFKKLQSEVSSDEKISILKELGVTNFNFYQTLIKNPMYTNEEPEEVSDGYKSGGYVAIIAEK